MVPAILLRVTRPETRNYLLNKIDVNLLCIIYSSWYGLRRRRRLDDGISGCLFTPMAISVCWNFVFFARLAPDDNCLGKIRQRLAHRSFSIWIHIAMTDCSLLKTLAWNMFRVFPNDHEIVYAARVMAAATYKKRGGGEKNKRLFDRNKGF